MYDGKHVDSLDKVLVMGENFPNYPYAWTSIDLKDMFNKEEIRIAKIKDISLIYFFFHNNLICYYFPFRIL